MTSCESGSEMPPRDLTNLCGNNDKRMGIYRYNGVAYR